MLKANEYHEIRIATKAMFDDNYAEWIDTVVKYMHGGDLIFESMVDQFAGILDQINRYCFQMEEISNNTK